MLRRYIIVNSVATVVMYAAASALTPSIGGFGQSFRQGIETYAMDSQLLGPLFHRVIVVYGR